MNDIPKTTVSALSREEKERTKRQKLIEGWNQAIVKDATVFIAGVGALGCEIAKDLALIGVGKLILCDMDKIETSNLSRQMLFYKGDEGRYKAEVAAERLNCMNPFMKIETYTIPLQKIPMEVYQTCHVVIAALDSVQARMDLNKFCLKLGIPLVEGGTVGLEGHVQVVIPKTTQTKAGQPFPFGNKERLIIQQLHTRLRSLTETEEPEYMQAQQKIETLKAQMEALETQIEEIESQKIDPIKAKFRAEIEQKINQSPEDWLHHTACYRCMVPIPPLLQDQVAACTLKGIPRNRDHCAVKGEVTFINKHNHKPNYKDPGEMEETRQYAQKELEELRERVLNESIPPEKRDVITPAEVQTLKQNIIATFGEDFGLEDMENILGNKVPAIQSVSSIISSIQSQEVLKIIYLMQDGDIGPIMDPPYLNYNGRYGLFDALPVFRRPDCVACGNRQGIDIFKVALPEDATVNDLFMAMQQVHAEITPESWMMTNPLSKQIIYNPLFEKGRTGDHLLSSFELHNLDEITLTPFGKAKNGTEIHQYNVILNFL